MEVYDACRLSTVGQAFYEDPYGNMYLATYDSPGGGWARGTMCYMRRKRKKKDWKNGHPWKTLFTDPSDKVRDRWAPVAPAE